MMVSLELGEMQALIEAATAGQRTGQLTRSKARLHEGLTKLRTAATLAQQMDDAYSQRPKS